MTRTNNESISLSLIFDTFQRETHKLFEQR